MTTLASRTEEILEKLVRLAYGDFELVQKALADTAKDAGGVPTLEAVVRYIVEHRRAAQDGPELVDPA
jgi:hypothetical protein